MASEQHRLNNLCEALGISIDQSDSSKWEQVGRILAQKHPAYTGKGKGRPKRSLKESIGDKRLRFVETIYQLHMPMADDATVASIKEYMRANPEDGKKLKLLFGTSTNTILTSIARARAKISRLQAATERKLRRLR